MAVKFLHLASLPILLAVLLPRRISAQEILSLVEARRLASEASPEIRLARLELEQAREQDTWGATGLLPQVGLNAVRNFQLTDIRQKFASGLVVDRRGVAGNQSSLGLALNWTLYDGGRMFTEKKRLGLMVHLAIVRLTQAEENLRDSVSQAFFQIALAGLDLEITRSERIRLEERLKLAGDLVRTGVRTRAEEVLARLEINRNEVRLLQQNLTLESRKTILNGLLNRDPQTPFEIDWKPESVEAMEFEVLKTNAFMGGNRGLVWLRGMKSLSELERKRLAAQVRPTLSLNSGYAFGRTRNSAGFALYNQSLGPSAGLTFSLPLFSGFPVKRAVKIARMEESIRDEEYRMAETRLYNTLWRLLRLMENQRKLEEAETEGEKLAMEFLELVMGRYRLAQATGLELREAETFLREARTRKARILVQMHSTRSAIQRLTGI
jgi:outer membrane protein